MTTNLVPLPSTRPAGPIHERDNRGSIGSVPEPHEGWPGRAVGGGRRAWSREREIERRRAWLFEVERCSAVLGSGAVYLVSVGTVMIVAYFVARLVASWIFGPVN